MSDTPNLKHLAAEAMQRLEYREAKTKLDIRRWPYLVPNQTHWIQVSGNPDAMPVFKDRPK